MKKITGILIVFLVAVFLSGCATGYRKSSMSTDKNGDPTYKGTNIGIFNPPAPGPGELADAQLKLALAKRIAENKSAGANVLGEYIGIIFNNDLRKTLYIDNPEMSTVYSIAPHTYAIIQVTKIPEFVYGYFSGQFEKTKFKIFPGVKMYDGISVDFGARIKSS